MSDFGTIRLNLEGKTVSNPFQEDLYQARIDITEEREGDISLEIVKVHVSIRQEAFRENHNLETALPVCVSIPNITGCDFCAQYQHRDWWSRPAFGQDLSRLPERTQSLFVKKDDTFSCYVPMAADKMKAYLRGTEAGPELVLTAYCGGISEVHEIALIIAKGRQFYPVVEAAWRKACGLRKIPGRAGRAYPEMLEYLGWCSWDAFYTDITEEKVLEKVSELSDKKLPFRWILLDDGWLSVRDDCLYSQLPEKRKFPEGFHKLTKMIREQTSIDHIGVWHALGGYWGGILPESEAALACRGMLYATKNGKLIPHYDPEKGTAFYRNWYRLLREQGIDFVKVDGQSALKNYYRDNEEIGRVAAGTHIALESAAFLHMGGNLINCMGMASENVLNRPTSAVSRNSDDFVPMEKGGFKEHLLQNTYNAIYHSQVYYGDWDMFWTSHPDAEKHALIRSISGGPIYVSDRIGETDGAVLSHLVYSDGRILRMDRSALPTQDCIFHSPLESGNVTLTNTIGQSGAAASFHIGEKEEAQTTRIAPKDLYGLKEGTYVVYDAFEKKAEVRTFEEQTVRTLEKGAYCLLLFLLKQTFVTPIGLLDKYMSAHAIMCADYTDNTAKIVLREGGRFGFFSEKPIKCLQADGEDLTDAIRQLYSCVYEVELPVDKQKITVEISG